ncbi:hypothetical protein [Acinetobacter sp.]|jgi:hypothetical protein|uniref:hypothetical protein n=1 Tax=Acinetobacter sp. TaxID=472 RepID=UPI0035ADD8CD
MIQYVELIHWIGKRSEASKEAFAEQSDLPCAFYFLREAQYPPVGWRADTRRNRHGKNIQINRDIQPIHRLYKLSFLEKTCSS